MTAVITGVVGVIVTVVLAASGCGANDAKVSARDTGPAEKINFPDKFDTVATKCSHGFRVFLAQNHTDQSSAITAVRDPACTDR